MTPKVVSAIAVQLRDEIVRSIDVFKRKRLLRCKFKTEWVHELVHEYLEKLARKVSRAVHYVCYIALKASSVASFFAQVKLLYSTKGIYHPCQVCNLEETGFTPEHDLVGSQNAQKVMCANHRAVIPNVTFNKPYISPVCDIC